MQDGFMQDRALPEEIENLSDADLAVVIELQKAELDRLLAENARLHERIEQLLAMQEREQVLRQQLQSMFREPQTALPPPEPNRRMERRAEKAAQRYQELKGALSQLVDVLERKSAEAAAPDMPADSLDADETAEDPKS